MQRRIYSSRNAWATHAHSQARYRCSPNCTAACNKLCHWFPTAPGSHMQVEHAWLFCCCIVHCIVIAAWWLHSTIDFKTIYGNICLSGTLKFEPELSVLQDLVQDTQRCRVPVSYEECGLAVDDVMCGKLRNIRLSSCVNEDSKYTRTGVVYYKSEKKTSTPTESSAHVRQRSWEVNS